MTASRAQDALTVPRGHQLILSFAVLKGWSQHFSDITDEQGNEDTMNITQGLRTLVRLTLQHFHLCVPAGKSILWLLLWWLRSMDTGCHLQGHQGKSRRSRKGDLRGATNTQSAGEQVIHEHRAAV